MHASFKPLTDFLHEVGAAKVPHTKTTYLAHVVGVYRDMEAHGCSEELCGAGMFHSIYGTERFQSFALPPQRRADVRALIGERAERLAYLNCAMDRASFDNALRSGKASYRILDRISGAEVDVSEEDFDDLCKIHLYDWLEQVPRSQEWDYRSEVYRRMADRLGGAAAQAYERVFTASTAASKN